MVQRVEAGAHASMTVYARLAQALSLELKVEVSDARRRTTIREDADLVHSAMGESEAALLGACGYPVGLDEPWQHYHFAGRADVLAWSVERRALLRFENKTRFPDVQDAIGQFTSGRTYLGTAVWQRLGFAGPPVSQAHVMVALWSSEVLRVIRRQPATFRSTWPDSMEVLAAWLRGDPPSTGVSSLLILLDPFASARQRPMTSLEHALGGVRPRVAGYAEAAARLRQRTAGA